MCRVESDPGKRSTPVHVHGPEEEILYVLGGSGLSWQDGKVFEVGAGDCLVHLPMEETHTLVAGPDGLDVLAYGTRVHSEFGLLPRAGVYRFPPAWVEVAGGAHPWEREVAAGELEYGEPEQERPGRIVNVEDVSAAGVVGEQRQRPPSGAEGVRDARSQRAADDRASPDGVLLVAEQADALAGEDDEDLLLGRVAVRRAVELPRLEDPWTSIGRIEKLDYWDGERG